MQHTVYHYAAFTSDPQKGNPAGVVLDADGLTEAEMQRIAARVGFNETAFVCRSRVADLRLRYFTPGHELPLCGHATIATLYALATRGLLPQGDAASLTVETLAGCLPMEVLTADGALSVRMQQAPAQFRTFIGSIAELAAVIGLEAADVDAHLPVLYGSTGTWTLLIPIRSLSAFARMQPQTERFPHVLSEMPRASLHPFCRETFDPHADLHGRHFSSPYSGTVEDPVTGTASGVLGAYTLEYIQPGESLRLVVEQGQEIGREGRVTVEARRTAEGTSVAITGTAVYAGDIEI